MDSSLCLTSSSSSSSSPSLGFGANEAIDWPSSAVTPLTAQLTSEDSLCEGDVVQVITQLTATIEAKLCQHEANNNLRPSAAADQSARELSRLYAIRAQSYLKLHFHQLAFDDSNLGIQFDESNANCHYLKGRALLGLKQKEKAEQAFKMAVELNKTHTEANEELGKLRAEALKKAGFDEDMAKKFVNSSPQTRSTEEDQLIDHILSASLTSDQLSKIRASYTRSLTNDNDNHSSFASISGIFGNKNLNKICGPKTNRDDRMDAASESLGSKLISDIDNCLQSILDSDEEKSKFLEKIDNKFSATNAVHLNDNPNNTYLNNNINTNTYTNANNNFCDIGDNLLPRSLSPQMSQNIFGVSPDLQHKPIHQQKAINFANFSIDLNKDSLGSHIIPKMVNNFNIGASGLEPRPKTFADIASANTKKPVQPVKTTQLCSSKTSHKNESKFLIDSGHKLSSLESFGLGSNRSESLNKIESFGGPPLVIPAPEPNRPTNIMAYKGLWVCNISPNTSYMTLRNVFKKYGNFTGLQTFERKATNGSSIVFVHYDNPQAPVDAIAELFGIYRKDICFDEKTPLKLRFTPSMDQTKAGDLPSMEKARRLVERTGECFNWRLSTGCHKGERCAFKHIAINKEIDSQPWVKALKKKANES